MRDTRELGVLGYACVLTRDVNTMFSAKITHCGPRDRSGAHVNWCLARQKVMRLLSVIKRENFTPAAVRLSRR